MSKKGTGTTTNDTSGAKYIAYFTTLPDGTIVASVEFPEDYSKPDKPGNTNKYYFEDANNNPLTTYGMFTDLSARRKGKRLHAQSSLKGVNMHYSHAKNEGGWGKLNMRTTNLPGQALPKDDGIAITQPVLPSSIFHNTTHLDPEDKDTHNPNLEFVTKISKIDGTTMPSRITVETDDTWGGIAAKQTGRSEYGEIIAEKNGCPNVDTPPTAGTVITIPAEFIPTTNSANDIVAYRTIQQAIQGSLLPVLYFNPKAKKQSCEETIVLTAIAVTAGIVAAEVVGPAAFSLSGALEQL